MPCGEVGHRFRCRGKDQRVRYFVAILSRSEDPLLPPVTPGIPVHVPDPVQAYPWDALPRLSNQAVVAGTRARRTVERALRVDAIGRALTHLAVAEVEVVAHDVVLPDREAVERLPLARARLRLADDSAELLVAVDPALATDVLRRVLARPMGLDDPRVPWSPPLQGAFEAVVLELARQSAGDRAVGVVASPVAPDEDADILVRATVTLERRAYAAAAVVRVRKPVPEGGRLSGSFPVQVPLVVGQCSTTAGELAELGRGDAWTCGTGWWIDGNGIGQGVLVSPAGEVGVLVDLAPDGSVVVRDETRSVPIEEANGTMDEPTEANEVTAAIAETVGETPVVVRVELGTVSLRARDWAQIRPGDVIRADQRIGAPVRLRVAGREVARGELVNIEGDLGVRITSLNEEST
jgi:flagellar motor switch/type III secretory pathway protein FliN